MWYQNYFIGGIIVLLGILALVFIVLFFRGIFKNKKVKEFLDGVADFLFNLDAP